MGRNRMLLGHCDKQSRATLSGGDGESLSLSLSWIPSRLTVPACCCGLLCSLWFEEPVALSEMIFYSQEWINRLRQGKEDNHDAASDDRDALRDASRLHLSLFLRSMSWINSGWYRHEKSNSNSHHSTTAKQIDQQVEDQITLIEGMSHSLLWREKEKIKKK